MILVIIRMKVLSEKRKELSQAIAFLIGSIRTEKGYQPSSQIETDEKLAGKVQEKIGQVKKVLGE